MGGSAVVSGAGSGIGAATANLLVENGWSVVGVDARDNDENGVCSTWVTGDVADEDTWQAVTAVLKAHSKRLDLLVNNAAVMLVKAVSETGPAEWDKVMATNVRSCYLAVRALHEFLLGGAVVNVASVHALATSPNISAYAASKGAMVSLTRELSIELADEGIRVNAVLPGAVDTPMLRNAMSRDHFSGGDVESRLNSLASRTVIGRIGKPEEIAEAIMFLGDNSRSSFVTGAALVVDGGATIRLSTE